MVDVTWPANEAIYPGMPGLDAWGRNTNTRMQRKVYLTDRTNPQSAIDAAVGGTVYVPPEGLTIDAPLLLYRDAPTAILGEGHKPVIRGSANFPEGRALIETVGSGRALDMQLENLSLHLPDVAGVKAFHHAVGDKSTLASMTAERLQLTMLDVTIYVDNAYHEVALHLEGGVHDSAFDRVRMQPKLAVNGYSTLLFMIGMEKPGDWQVNYAGADVPGLFSSEIRNCKSSISRGGKSALFAGRAVQSEMHVLFCDGGSGIPCYDFYDSVSVTLTQLATEGRNEQPQYRFTRCDMVDARQIGIGTPDDYYATGLGNGIELIDCHDCKFDGRWNFSGKPSFSGKGTKVVTVDSASSYNTFKRWKIKSGGNAADEFTLAGVGNSIEYTDYGVTPVVRGTLTS